MREFTPNFISKVNAIKQTDFFPSESYCKKQHEFNGKYATLKELLESEDLYHVCIYIPLLDINKIDLDLLEMYLKQHLKDMDKNTHLRKLICYYDFLRYKPFRK